MGVTLYGDHVSLPGGVGVFRWLHLQYPSCSNPQRGRRVVCTGGVCTWGLVNSCMAHYTLAQCLHLPVGADPRLIGSLRARKLQESHS